MNNKSPLISVALTTYNGEKFLREQLDSIFAQTYKNIEVIACDDCSSDGTVGILEEYSQKYGLKYYRNEKNLGFVKNFEKAISLCTGEYIALSDHDDVWKKEKLQSHLREIGDYDLIFADAEIIDGTGKVLFNSFKDYISVRHPKKNQLARLLYGNYIYGASMFFKASLKNKILPFPDGIPYHDIWIAYAAAEKDRIKFDSTILNRYRLHGDNNTGVSNLSDFKNKLKFHCQDENLRMTKRRVYVDMIRYARLKYTDQTQTEEFNKAEKFHELMLNRDRTVIFRLRRLIYLMYFSIKNKYIFEPDLSFCNYLFKLFEHFIISSSAANHTINLFFKKKNEI